ncbi:MAG: Peptidoglycan glycosyltransferase [Chloroflexi bacterium]|jgi:cell division protein FtsI/penicillin-binding protein 2|nr:Peptidoglycan glycosyltransferase [Chloroflexota bacterium]
MSPTLEKPPARPRPARSLLSENEPTIINSRRPARAARQTSLLGDAAKDFDVPRPPATERNRKFFYLSPFTRIRITIFFITLFALAIFVQLFTLQIQDRYQSREYAQRNRLYTTPIPATRGLILDTNGLVLASNTFVYNIFASPKDLTERQSAKIADILAPLLPDVPKAQIKEAVTFGADKRNHKLVAAGVSFEAAEKIRQADILGITIEAPSRRTYPNNSMLSNLLGFVNYENNADYGLEGKYNEILRGTPGSRYAEHDADGNPIVLGQIQLTPAVEGGNISLTIDASVQNIVERELLKGMLSHSAEKAMAIVADPQTGQIIAWANFPNYNPNEFFKSDTKLFRDPLVSDIYEPGSTFKILTAAIGIETGVVAPNSAADLPGCVIEYGHRICNFDSVGYPNQTVIKTLEKSSNVGAMWIAKKFGPDRYYQYMKSFGIGAPTGIDLKDEGIGIFRSNKDPNWSPLDYLQNSFGQAVAVTPIQLVAAVSAVANGGKLMKPYVVSKITRNGEIIEQNQPTFVRQVISAQSARTTTDMLVSAVRQGETRLADVKGYKVAGKTGTATLFENGVESQFTIGSTIAYAPADNPRFVVLVRYDKTKDTPWGSNTAAPVVKTITEQLFNYYKIAPTETK